jgi:hypothetical protein
MPLEVIGAGFGRTGTLSMKMALDQLGLGPCHHMLEIFGKPDQVNLWLAAAEGKSVDWEEVFDGYRSAVDWPSCYFWKELIAFYPDARVLLTKREAEQWFKSADATIFKGMRLANEKAKGNVEDPFRKMVNTIVVDNTFGGDLSDAANAIKVFNRHNQEVIDAVPADRLLVFEASDGWKPLCDFLEVAVPDTDYPRSNSTGEFVDRVKSARLSK